MFFRYGGVVSSGFGPGVGPILIDELDCDGTETNLTDCSFEFQNHNCEHTEDAGVTCIQGQFKKLFTKSIWHNITIKSNGRS